METWRLLAGVSVMLVLWTAVMVALGEQPGPGGFAVAIGAAVVGLYLGEVLGNRIRESKGE
jgi:hypothetical protein